MCLRVGRWFVNCLTVYAQFLLLTQEQQKLIDIGLVLCHSPYVGIKRLELVIGVVDFARF